MNKWKSLRARLFLFFAIMGPGIITANVDNDAGGIATYSVCGAQFGYNLLWSFLPIIIALIVIQEMCSRMAVVTGKGLADLIREEFGVRITFYSMLVLILANIGNTMAEFAGIAASAELFGINKVFLVLISALAVWFLVLRGTYKSVEKIFLVACVFYIAYIISGFIVKPDWGGVATSVVRPKITMNRAYLFMFIGLVGTTIAPWMQFYQQSAVVEKEIKIKDYFYNRLDVIIGAFVVNIVAIFIVIVCAATLHKSGIQIHTAQDAARALQPLAGNYCYLLFAFGLFNASLFAASILPLTTAYTVCEGLGWELGVNKTFREAPHFYWLYSIIIVLGAATTLIPRINYVKVMLVTQVANGVLLPFVLVLMLSLVNRKRLMGEYTNSLMYNIISWVVIVVMIVLSIALVFSFVGKNPYVG